MVLRCRSREEHGPYWIRGGNPSPEQYGTRPYQLGSHANTHAVPFAVYTTPHSEPNILRLSNVITYEDIEQLRAIYTIHDSSDH